MKDTDKIMLGAFGLSWLLSFTISIILALMLRGYVNGNIENIMIANLQLNGVLFGFTATIFAFVLKRLEGCFVESRMSLAYATTSFVSFFFSISYDFYVLLNVEQALLIFKLLPIGFTLTGIITTVAFIVDITLRMLKKQRQGRGVEP
jgi:hypothetical protein